MRTGQRKKTRVIHVGNIPIGGGHPIVVQSMTKTDTRDAGSTVRQIRRLARFLRERRIDIVHTHDFYTNVFGMIAAALARVPVRIVSRRETTGCRTPAQRVLERGAYECADMERMMEVAERLYGPYRWGRYDVLILPPSFPYGGMENPRLTFLTPTSIIGDRSGVALIAHELAHSWSGNLVTNATWRDFWLNEGTTTYLQDRIMDELYGTRRGDMERVLGQQDLVTAFAQAATEGDKALAYDQRGRDPDEVFSQIPYERGHLFRGHADQVLLGVLTGAQCGLQPPGGHAPA